MTDTVASSHFADRLVLRCRELGHPLCVGLDPHLDLVPELFRHGSMSPEDPRTPEAVETMSMAVLDRLAGRVAVVKPQIAFFEQLGPEGMGLLARVVARARQLGLLVLLDAKRGDIGSTATAYARAYLGEDAALPCDAITLNPYLGLDSLKPFVDRARDEGGGLFVLVKTSNPGAADFQDQKLAADGESLHSTVARALREDCDRLGGPDTGWSSLGVVVGATWPGESEGIREQLPKALFLVPGYGAQGGSAADAVKGFVRGPEGKLEGGVVNSSRGILFPRGSHGAALASWQRIFDQALERAIDELGEAVG